VPAGRSSAPDPAARPTRTGSGRPTATGPGGWVVRRVRVVWPGWGLRPGNAECFGDAAAAYGTRTAEPGIGSAGTGTGAGAGAAAAAIRPAPEPRTASLRHAAPDYVADSKGLLGALFDFGFQSFVTPTVVKTLYVLIMIGTVVRPGVYHRRIQSQPDIRRRDAAVGDPRSS
jgi:hypothetical protein